MDQFAEVNGARLRVFDSGGFGPVVVLLHALFLSARSWQGLDQSLRRSFRVVIIEFRGHGLSDCPGEGPVFIEQLVQDVESVLVSRGITAYNVVGHSLGAEIALRLALSVPDLVKSVVAISADGDCHIRESIPQCLSFIEVIRSQGLEPLVEVAMQLLTAPSFLTDATRAGQRQHLLDELRRAHPSSHRVWQGYLERLPIRAGLPSLRCPTLTIVGLQDHLLPVDRMKDMAASIPLRHRRILEVDAGHSPHIERPDEVQSHITKFLFDHTHLDQSELGPHE